jgi:hypothetical protein
VIVLMYGSDSQWVRNVLAAGAADVLTQGRRIHLVGPEVIRDAARSRVPAPIRPMLRLVRADKLMLLRQDAPTSGAP